MPICTIADAFRFSGLPTDESVISNADMTLHVEEAEDILEKFVDRRFMSVEDSGTATSGTTTTLTDTGQTFTVDEHAGRTLEISGGTGAGQFAVVISNTTDTLTFAAITTAPDSTSTYRVVRDIFFNETRDGDGSKSIFLFHPNVKLVSSFTNGDDTLVEGTDFLVDNRTGRIFLLTSNLDNTKPQKINFKYFAGVFPVPKEAAQMCGLIAAQVALVQQMGGTFNTPSTYTVPEGSISIGQAYVNIQNTLKELQSRIEFLQTKVLSKTPSFS